MLCCLTQNLRFLPRSLVKTVRCHARILPTPFETQRTELLLKVQSKSARAAVSARFFTNWRYLSTETPKDVPNEDHSKEEETVKDLVKKLYTFPNIKPMRTITNLKIYQTALYMIVVPYVYSSYLKGHVTAADFASSVTLMTVATVMLYVISLVARRIICVLKYNEETKEVHIAHLTFWGRRKDVTLRLEDIVPLSDTEEGDKINDAYLKLETYDKTYTFYLFHKFCTREQAEEILKIFR